MDLLPKVITVDSPVMGLSGGEYEVIWKTYFNSDLIKLDETVHSLSTEKILNFVKGLKNVNNSYFY